MMSHRIWPSFMLEPEYLRELENEEWEKHAQEWEDDDHRRANGDPYFKEGSPA